MALTSKYSPRKLAFFGLVAVAILITVLLYLEQIAVLYVMATLALVALLVTVAVSDLENVDRDTVTGGSDRR